MRNANNPLESDDAQRRQAAREALGGVGMDPAQMDPRAINDEIRSLRQQAEANGTLPPRLVRLTDYVRNRRVDPRTGRPIVPRGGYESLGTMGNLGRQGAAGAAQWLRMQQMRQMAQGPGY